jgi:hypothetical protein
LLSDFKLRTLRFVWPGQVQLLLLFLLQEIKRDRNWTKTRKREKQTDSKYYCLLVCIAI